MASVRLDFVPPDDQGLTKLHILESPDGISFTTIETVTSIGAYPNYITYYTTTHAASESNYFAIQWEDASGAQSEVSTPMRGGTTTLVQQIVNRVMLRDPLANENIAAQEAEAVIEEVFGAGTAYTVDPATVSAKQRSGITFLTLARVYLSSLATSIGAASNDSYTAGLVSQNAGSNQSQVSSGLSNVEQLIKWANADLGLNYSVVLLLEEISVGEFSVTSGDYTFEALGL